MDRRFLIAPLVVLALASGAYFWSHANEPGRMIIAGMGFLASVAATTALVVTWKESSRGE